MYEFNPIFAIDAYKLGHMTMYPENTEEVYCNLTPRSFKIAKRIFPEDKKFFDDKLVAYGMSAVIQNVNESFKEHFFERPFKDIEADIRKYFPALVGGNSVEEIVSRFKELHDLGFLPIEFKTLPEGSLVGEGIPIMTWKNADKRFGWLPNFLETFISAEAWKLPTAATIARVYRNIFDYYAEKTGVPKEFVNFQGHDFSSRGMSGIIDASRTGSAHTLFFYGSDAVSAIPFIEKFYGGDDLIMASVPATEHSVMCMGSKEGEFETYKRLINQYDTGIVSIVSDTWDYWNVLNNILPALEKDIMDRKPDAFGNAKVVIRPDSGDPVDIVCGETKESLFDIENWSEVAEKTPERFGTVDILARRFGYTKTKNGFKTINEKLGVIYGDSITPVRAYKILKKLAEKGYASNNIVLGIGSFTYQYMTRDTFGFAIKATHGIINGEKCPIFKDPKTDTKKKSAKGYMKVFKIGNEFVLEDNQPDDTGGELEIVYKNGEFIKKPTYKEIRDRIGVL